MLVAPATAADAQSHETCVRNPVRGTYECHVSGEEPGVPGDRPPRNPIRYLYTTTVGGVDCHYWSQRPGGIDTWDAANDPLTIAITTGLPECVWPDPEARAWEVFRSFPLAVPVPELEPPGVGIVKLPTFLSVAAVPAPITSTEALPDGRLLEVEAEVVAVEVDWGDGALDSYRPDEARPYPEGAVTHAYVYRTCPAAERETTNGGPCHPSLEAYPVVVSFLWEGRWRTDPAGPFQPLDTVVRTVTVTYPVDEVQGVLVDP